YTVAPFVQPLGQCSHFDRRAPELQEGLVARRDIQDSHCSRRILLRDLAKTLKRKSSSTRFFPRAPISRPTSGCASSVSSDVASCTASPCCTRYPVLPSSITSGAPPWAPPMTGFPRAIASK